MLDDFSSSNILFFFSDFDTIRRWCKKNHVYIVIEILIKNIDIDGMFLDVLVHDWTMFDFEQKKFQTCVPECDWHQGNWFTFFSYQIFIPNKVPLIWTNFSCDFHVNVRICGALSIPSHGTPIYAQYYHGILICVRNIPFLWL